MSRRDPDVTQPIAPAQVWLATTATARGSSHVRSGLPNQDAALVRDVPTVGAVVAAVADGHGGSRYVRSDAGATFAVSIACELAADFATRRGDERERTIQRHAAVELVPQIVDRWMDAVRAHAAQHPFTDDERARAGVDLEQDVPYAYGATLLFAIATTGWVLVGQLGDGDVIAVDQHAIVTRPVPRDSRLVAGQTTSLCLPDAPRDLRLVVLPASSALETLLLASDGYGNSFAGADWWESVGRDVQSQVRERGLESVGASLPEWAADSADVGGDDVTIAVLGRTVPAPQGIGATVPLPLPVPPVPAPDAARRRRRWPLLVVILVVALAAAAAVVALLAGGDGSDAEGTSVTTTTVPPSQEAAPAVSTTVGAPVAEAALRILEPSAETTWIADSTYVVRGRVDPASTVTITVRTKDGDTEIEREAHAVAVDETGSWSQPVGLVEGPNLVDVEVVDPRPALPPRTERRTITVDSQRPDVRIEAPTDGATHAPGAVTVRGWSEPGARILVDGTERTAALLDGSWSFAYELGSQTVTMQISASDAVGPGPATPLTLRARPASAPTTAPPATTATTVPPVPPPTTAVVPVPTPPPGPQNPPGPGAAAPGGRGLSIEPTTSEPRSDEVVR